MRSSTLPAAPSSTDMPEETPAPGPGSIVRARSCGVQRARAEKASGCCDEPRPAMLGAPSARPTQRLCHSATVQRTWWCWLSSCRTSATWTGLAFDVIRRQRWLSDDQRSLLDDIDSRANRLPDTAAAAGLSPLVVEDHVRSGGTGCRRRVNTRASPAVDNPGLPLVTPRAARALS